MIDKHHPLLRIAGPRCRFVVHKQIKEGAWFLQYPTGYIRPFNGGVRVIIKDVQMRAEDWIVRPPVVSMDPNSPCYKAIKIRSDIDGENCLHGPEYLLTVVDGKEQARLYLGNKSSRDLMSTIRVGGKYILFPCKKEFQHHVWYIPNVVDVEVFDKT